MWGRQVGLAVAGVTFEAAAGVVQGIIGPDGAGKTTTSKAISGMLSDEGDIHSGRVTLAREEVTGKPAHRMVRRGLVHVFEGRFVFPDLTVRDNLRMGAYSRRQDRRSLTGDLDRALGCFPRLGDRLQLEAGYLSGGKLFTRTNRSRRASV